MNITEKKKVALVLSGGGIKAAAFHIGVCLALEQKGFSLAGGTPAEVESFCENAKLPIRVYVGSSGGAVISTLLAAGYGINSITDAFQMGAGIKNRFFPKHLKRLKPLTYFDIFNLNGSNFLKVIPTVLRRKSIVTGGIEALLKNGFKINGIFTTKGLEKYIRKNVLADNRFSALGVELYIVATQLNHSRKVIFGNFSETYKVKTIKYAHFSSVSDAVAASASLPPVFAPYGIKNQKGKELYYFDGEIRDTLSTHVAADHGADLVISSYSIQPYHYNPEMGSLHNYGIPLIINQALYQLVEQKIQSHISHQKQITAIYNAVEGYCNQSGISAEHRDKLLEIIAIRVKYNPHTDYLYIHPSPQDFEMFFVDHFSLNPKILERIVRIGFKAAMNTLRKHDI